MDMTVREWSRTGSADTSDLFCAVPIRWEIPTDRQGHNQNRHMFWIIPRILSTCSAS